MERFSERIAQALKLPVHRVENTLKLLEGGATIPFISRYRKEATGGMDEVQIGEIQARNEKLGELAKRKETVLATIEGLGKLTPELRARIEACWDATELEDIYLPYKPKRKTRAEMARQKGLEPLAALLLMQRENRLEEKVRAFVKGEVKDEDDALRGARDIIAEQVSEDEQTRNVVRTQFARGGERERVGRGGFEVPRLFRFLRTPEALHFPPPVSFAPGRVGRCLEGEHCPSRRRCVRRAFRASVCAGRGGLFRSGGRGGRRCLQAFAQARYRDRVCSIQQGTCRRGSHPCVCRKSPPAVVGSAFGAEAGDVHRPRIPNGMQGGVSRCARRVAA